MKKYSNHDLLNGQSFEVEHNGKIYTCNVWLRNPEAINGKERVYFNTPKGGKLGWLDLRDNRYQLDNEEFFKSPESENEFIEKLLAAISPKQQETTGAEEITEINNTFKAHGAEGGAYGLRTQIADWKTGDVIYDEKQKYGHEFFTVLEVKNYYQPVYDDGETGGETEFVAICRPATEDEQKAKLAKIEAGKTQAAAQAEIRAIADEIRARGEKPENAEPLKGEKIPVSRYSPDNDYLLIAEDWIWRIVYNGRDGDLWAVNNLTDSIGCRVAKTPELMTRIKKQLEILEVKKNVA